MKHTPHPQGDARLRHRGGLCWIAALLLCGCVPEIRPEVRTIVLGDSLTGTLESDTYPRLLAAALGTGTAQFAAEGSGGRTVAEGLQRLQDITDWGLYPNADRLLYFLGGADIIAFVTSRDPGLAVAPSESAFPFNDELTAQLAAIRADMAATLQLASSHGLDTTLTTYFALPSGVTPCEPFGGSPLDDIEAMRANEYIDLLNALILDLADEWHLPVVDLRLDSAALADDPDNFSDCTHPSLQGAAIIARRFALTLQEPDPF